MSTPDQGGAAAPPSRAAQRRAALNRGNQLRSQVSAVKAMMGRPASTDLSLQLVRGNVTGADTWPAWDGTPVPLVPEDAIRTMRLRDMIEAVRGIGPVTADEIMEAVGFDLRSKVRVRDLSYDLRGRTADLIATALGVA